MGPELNSLNVCMSRFNYSVRSRRFDWRLLHGINIEGAVNLDDVQAVEACLPTLQHGQLSLDKGLSVRNYLQLFRMLQLALEYVHHLNDAHKKLIDHYNGANDAAEGWLRAGRAYLDDGRRFVNECTTMAAMSRKGLARVDLCRAEFDAAEAVYNQIIEDMEADENQSRCFRFKRQRCSEFNWQQLYAIDVEEVVTRVKTSEILKVTNSLMFGNIASEDRGELTPHHFEHLIPLAQCALDIIIHRANSSGVQLEQAMSRLRSTQWGMPDLVLATSEIHGRISSIILDARQTSLQPPQSQSVALQGSFSGRSSLGWEGSLLTPTEIQHRTTELQYKVGALDQELRNERSRTDRLQRLMVGIRDVVSPRDNSHLPVADARQGST